MASDAATPAWVQRLQRSWLSKDWLARTLLPVAWLYRGLLALRRLAYRCGWAHTHRLPVPVLVVGNVVVGGAGKTPTVIALVQHLQQQGWRPGVVSRGYGRRGHACLEVTPHSTSAEVGDEPCLIARATQAPTFVGRQRVQAAQHLLRQHPEVDIIVSDDGMQHWPLARDLTVVVFDERGTGNGWLLPAGLLREPWPTRPWGTGPLLVLQQSRDGHTPPPIAGHGQPVFQARRRLAPRARAASGAQRALADLPRHRLAALAGIAQPEAFFDMLRAHGLALAHTVALPDHADAATLLAALQPGYTWLCTEKDAVKLFPALPSQATPEVWTVPLEQTPEPAFWSALDQVLDGLSSAHGRQTP